MDPDDHKVMDGDRYSDTFQDVMQDMQNLDISESHSGEAFRLSVATHQSGVFKSIFEIIESSSVNPLFEIINESLTNCDYLQISRTITTNPLVRQLSLERFVTDNFDAFDSPKSPTKDFLVWTAFWCDFLPYNVIKKGADWISTLKVKILGRDYLEYCTELRRIQQKIIAFDPRYEQFYSEWRHRWIS